VRAITPALPTPMAGGPVEDDFTAATAAFLKHLVVVSDPRILGEMCKHFHRDLRGEIIGELAKDFSQRPLEDIVH
jgi:protein required for attachment to host cells